MLQVSGLGADEVAPLWSMTTGSCAGGQYDTLCRPYSGSAGKAYNCVGCSSPNQTTIRALQAQLLVLSKAYGVQAQFGVGKRIVADKVIGLNTARAVGILGTMAMGKGLGPSPVLTAVISLCASQVKNLEAKLVSNTSVQRAIQAVAKHVPALLAYFEAAATRGGGVVVPPPPVPDTPPPVPGTPPSPVPPVATMRPHAKIAAGFLAAALFVVAGAGIAIAGRNSSKKRRR
jgi:hypothetical protein